MQQRAKQKPQQTAIIGAGIAGLTLAARLSGQPGHTVTVFDKSRGLGGRMAVRRSATHSFDHGARYFIARDDRFKAFLKPYLANGDVVNWTPKVVTLKPGESPYKRLWYEPHYIGSPQMNSLCKAMATDFDAKLETVTGAEVTAIEGEIGRWLLQFKDGTQRGPFNQVLLTVPAPQAVALALDPDMVRCIESVRFEPCFSLMVALAEDDPLVHGHKALASTFDAAQAEGSSLEWVCFNHMRPGRVSQPALLAQTTAEWARDHLELPPEEVKARLLADFNQLLGTQPLDLETVDAQLHRWRYAQAEAPLGEAFLMSDMTVGGISVCGDWCLGRGVEAAFLSASALADALLQELKR